MYNLEWLEEDSLIFYEYVLFFVSNLCLLG